MMSLSTEICPTPSRTGPHFTPWRHAWALALLLLCAPLWAAPTDMILVLDNSGSMRQTDPAFLLTPAPVERARAILGAENVPEPALGTPRVAIAIRHWSHEVEPETWETALAEGLDEFVAGHVG